MAAWAAGASARSVLRGTGEEPVHADVHWQAVIFIDGPGAISTSLKAKGVGALGLCGVAAAIANAVYNATGIPVRHYPFPFDKPVNPLPAM